MAQEADAKAEEEKEDDEGEGSVKWVRIKPDLIICLLIDIPFERRFSRPSLRRFRAKDSP
jgi:hypothetical protein